MSSSEIVSVPSEMAQEAAAKQVREVGIELNTIKNAMKKLSMAYGSASATATAAGKDANNNGEGGEAEGENSFKIAAIKIVGLPESAQPKLNIQLSSPIESQTITSLYDPLDDDNNDNNNDNDNDKEQEENKNNDTVNDGEEKEVDKEANNEEGEGKGEGEGEGEGEGKAVVENEDKNEEKLTGEKGGENEEKTSSSSSSLPPSSSYAIFKGVDTSVATFTIAVSDLGIPLGSSATYDVGPLTEIDVLGGVTKKTTELEVAIVPDDHYNDNNQATATATSADVVDADADAVSNNDKDEVETESEHFQDAISDEGETAEKTDTTKIEEESSTTVTDDDDEDDGQEKEEEGKEKEDDTPEGEKGSEDVVEETKPIVIVPICTLHLKIEYNASTRDQIEILNEKYNAAIARQSVAVDKLRKIAIAVRRAQMAAAASLSSSNNNGDDENNKKPAVKPGFLDKKPKNKKEPMFLVRWYQKTLGPNSLLRKVYPLAKNYVLFFGGVVLMHFQGYQLALPPPV